MNTPDNQRSRLTRKLLKQAYLELMHDKPTSKITVKEICEGAEVNRTTFYLHFTEPNDILKEFEDETIAQMTESLSKIGALNQPSPDLTVNLVSFLHYVRKNDELFRTLLVENSDPHFRRKMHAIAINMVESSFDINLTTETKRCVFNYIVSGSIELITDWIRNQYPVSESRMCDILYRLCEGSLKNIYT